MKLIQNKIQEIIWKNVRIIIPLLLFNKKINYFIYLKPIFSIDSKFKLQQFYHIINIHNREKCLVQHFFKFKNTLND